MCGSTTIFHANRPGMPTIVSCAGLDRNRNPFGRPRSEQREESPGCLLRSADYGEETAEQTTTANEGRPHTPFTQRAFLH
jgi:hypothetical protein